MSKRLRVLGLVGVLLASLALPVEAGDSSSQTLTCRWCKRTIEHNTVTGIRLEALTTNVSLCTSVRATLYWIENGSNYMKVSPEMLRKNGDLVAWVYTSPIGNKHIVKSRHLSYGDCVGCYTYDWLY